MGEAPALFTLCIDAVKIQILHGENLLENVYELPSDLFDCILTHLPALALHKLQEMLLKHGNDDESTISSSKDGRRKRGRYGNFNTTWRTLFKSRWPEDDGQPFDWFTEQGMAVCEPSDDWQQIYWEAHLQNCLDKASEAALLPFFDGCIGDIVIPDIIIKSIGYEGFSNDIPCYHSKLSSHCQQFGCFARRLRLQNVLCVAETCKLLSKSKLQSIVLQRINSKDHVNGVCKLLNQNKETLSSIEFNHCKFPSTSVDAIFDSLYTKGIQTHGIRCLSIKESSFSESNPISLPYGLFRFLSSGRMLCSLTFCDNCLGPNFARLVFDTLLEASCGLSLLDISENNISGWLFNFNGRFSSCHLSSLGVGKCLQSLCVLNLRGNNLRKDDADCLKYALDCMPNLELLDLSDNPIGDYGIRSLVPYLSGVSERSLPLVNVKIENCDLSADGVAQLLEVLSSMKKPLNALSIGNNDLGSRVATPMAKFLGKSSVRALNIEDIELGPSGFLELQEGLPEEMKLKYLNISKNRGGIETARFMSKLILRAPDLVAVNAGFNFMPAESFGIICSALKLSTGKLEQVDLTGNTRCYHPSHASMLSEFQYHGKPVVILPLSAASSAPYDDDP